MKTDFSLAMPPHPRSNINMSPSVFSGAAVVTGSTLLASDKSPAGPAQRTQLGLVTYCFNLAAKNHGTVPSAAKFSDPLIFIQEAAALGASAVQIPFGICDATRIWAIRDASERLNIALESTVALPKNDPDLERFDAELKTLRELGVKIARTVLLPGRRYEQFTSILDYANTMRVATKALSDAEKIARKHGVKLALENHKDHTTEERLALLEQFSSEHIGACLDVGNNMALLEDPVETARAFAPWTLTVHFKDQAVRESADGFLLADVPVGRGAIDLREIIKIVREKKPQTRFHLELITRDPLRIPVLLDSYWRTLDAIKAPQLASTFATLKERSSKTEFPLISKLSPAEQVRTERDNIEQSLRYSAEQLGL
jgi:sugar phosphate isomerase/epimerase